MIGNPFFPSQSPLSHPPRTSPYNTNSRERNFNISWLFEPYMKKEGERWGLLGKNEEMNQWDSGIIFFFVWRNEWMVGRAVRRVKVEPADDWLINWLINRLASHSLCTRAVNKKVLLEFPSRFLSLWASPLLLSGSDAYLLSLSYVRVSLRAGSNE